MISALLHACYGSGIPYFPILNILVPHTGHVPWVAGLRFFMVMALGFLISLLARHLTQYACISPPPSWLESINYFVI